MIVVQATTLCGCANLRIDPSGQRIFLPTPDGPPSPIFSGPLFGRGPLGGGLLGGCQDDCVAELPIVPPGGTCGAPQQYGWEPHPLLNQTAGLPPFPSVAPNSAPAPIAPPQPFLPLGYGDAYDYNNALATSGGDPFKGHEAQLALYPRRLVAPVGQTVVLQAGICARDGYFLTDQPIEWSLSPDSVGSIVEVDRTDQGLLHHLLHKPPVKKSGNYAVGRTSIGPQILTRGNLNPTDDVRLRAGETWIRLSSTSEGATHLSAVAPTVTGWEQRKQDAIIHWVDGRWQFPAPAIGSYGGGHTLVTRVARATDGLPVEGWLVRYEIAGGTPAAFDLNGAQTMEVPTNSNGEAAITVIPQGDFQGTTQVNMQVIRVGRTPSDLPRLPVGQGSTTITWAGDAGGTPPLPSPGVPAPGQGGTTPTNTPSLITRVTGPNTADVGASATYQVRVDNLGNGTAENVDLSCEIPNGMTYVDSSPQASVFGNTLRWELGAIETSQARSVTVTYSIDAGGQKQVCATARDAASEDATDCVVTDVRSTQPRISVRVQGDSQARVGDQAHFDIFVRNESDTPIQRFDVNVTYDPNALAHEMDSTGIGRISKPVGYLGPRESWQPITLDLGVRSAGRRCFTVEVVADNSASDREEVCIEVQPQGAGAGGVPGGGGFNTPQLNSPPTQTNPPPLDLGGNALPSVAEDLAVRVIRRGADGSNPNLSVYVVEVTNVGNVADSNVVLQIRTPEGTRFENAYNPANVSVVRRDPNGRDVDFSPVAALRAGESVSYQISVSRTATNVGTFQARVMSDRYPTPIDGDDRN